MQTITTPRYWDATYTRLDRELSAARKAHDARPFQPVAWQAHIDAQRAFDDYRERIHAAL